MRKITLLCMIAMAMLGSSSVSAAGIPETVIGGYIVKDVIQQLTMELKGIAGDAVQGGDYLEEQGVRRVELLLQGMRYDLSRDMDKRVDQLSEENQKFVYTINRMVQAIQEFQNGLLEIEDFLVLDINDVLNRFPGLGQKFLLRRVRGCSQIYQERGEYTFELVGNAFQSDTIYNISIDGRTDIVSSIDNSRANVIKFTVPAEALKARFDRRDVRRIDFSITCSRKPRSSLLRPGTWFRKKPVKVYEYSTKILLLPMYPVRYKLIEYTKSQRWSDEDYWSAEGHTMLPATGQEYRWRWGNVSVSIPPGCLMVKDRYEVRAVPGTHCATGGVRWTDGDRTIIADVGHYIHDQPSHFYIRVRYRKPISTTEDNPVHFPTDVDGDLLPYGMHAVQLSDSYSGYTLQIEMFNGRQYTLLPSKPSCRVAEASMENLNGFRRLILDVGGDHGLQLRATDGAYVSDIMQGMTEHLDLVITDLK